jgi:hypothetical protein
MTSSLPIFETKDTTVSAKGIPTPPQTIPNRERRRKSPSLLSISRTTDRKECPRSRYVIVFKKTPTGRTYKKVKIACNTWSCPVCSVRLKHILYKRIKKACPKKDFNMLTLTLRQNEDSLIDNWKRLQKCWTMLHKRLKRKFDNIKYFRCVELQKNGMPHMHLLINCYLPRDEIQKIWLDITGDSFIARFEKVKVSCAGYVMKYMSKSLVDIRYIRNFTGKKTKLYVYSRNLLEVCLRSSDWKLYYFCKLGESPAQTWTQIFNLHTGLTGLLKPPDIFYCPDGSIFGVDFFIRSIYYKDDIMFHELTELGKGRKLLIESEPIEQLLLFSNEF